ncbi:flagellar export chaperone FliS [Stratiformator vulcanicus]|uniref:Flagellar protein FliS n=1 Tax=Stratiformator vulcanicus TaxID=2527980 RepID=A0A517QXF1_9PLAN|nr:flagellar export chaperone FliS [Stratiformator vulcanicus]QDT36332.1 Flagellar protein FliS [Stratiformator vulcanicus]
MNIVDEYLESKVMGAQPAHLHLMVVEGAIRHSKRAAAAIEEDDRETSWRELSSARDFVTELISGLKKDQAPEIVSNVALLFVFAYRQLVEADTYQDAAKVREAVGILESHRDNWLELIEQGDLSQPAPSAAKPHFATDTPSAEETEHISRSWSG